MKFYLLKIQLLVCAIVLSISACGPTKPEIIKVDPAFGEYVSGYTSGMVTRKSNIRVELADPMLDKIMNQNGEPDSNLIQDIFSFEPELKGRAVWVNERVVEFIPDETLPADQFYTVDFDLERVARVKPNFENFKFQFATYQQAIFVNVNGLQNYDDYNIEWQYLEGRVMTSDFADTSKLKSILKATQNNKALNVRLEKSYYDENEYFFYVDSIERKEVEGTVLLTWDGTPLESISRGKKEIKVTALGDFSVTSAKVKEDEDQFVQIKFSEPLDATQNLKGIIAIEGIDNLSFNIDYNTVNVYLPKRYLGNKQLTISNGIKNFRGYKRKKEYKKYLEFEEPKPQVKLRGSGSILPSSNGLIFPFEAISLKSIDVRVIKIYESNVHHFLQVNDLDGSDELTRFGKVIAEKKIRLDYDGKMNLKTWNKHVIDLEKLIKPDQGAIYRVSIKFSKSDAICDCGNDSEESVESDYEEAEVPIEEEDENWTESTWNSYGFDGGYDSWNYYSDDYNPCDNSYYSGKAVSRNILASDLGMIFKLDADKKSHAFVSDMLTTKPIPNATVEYYSYSKQVIASGVTDSKGMLDIQLKEKPFLMIAKFGKQRGYLKLLDGYSNSLSKFDVEGEVLQKGIKGFIYGERGVWRPGDSLYLTFILENKDKKIPLNHPVKFELQDPNGQVVYQVTKTQNENWMYDFRCQTSSEAPTGNYRAIVKVGNSIFSKNLKVETVKPNRLKIYMAQTNKGDSAKVNVKWLHGATAKNLKMTVNAKITSVKTTFDKYKGYDFDSPVRKFSSNDEFVFDGKLDENGEAMIKTKLNVGKNAQGMLRATYITKVFEKGGDFSIDRTSLPYSPFKTYIGIKAPTASGFDHALETDTKYRFDIVALNEAGNLSSARKLQVKIYKIQWRWWYEKDEEDFASYISRAGTIVVQDTLIDATDGKAFIQFNVTQQNYGRYLFTVTDLEGQHQTGTVVTFDWPYWSRANKKNSENANMLNFACDKDNYRVGENVQVSFPSPAVGRALISVETRTKVLFKTWIETKAGETFYSFPTTKEMSPNAFVHVTLIQPHANTKNDLPIRMYGVVPLMVDDPSTHLNPVISMADVLKPETTTNIRVKEKSGRKMTYTLAIVDEGLLDLTSYKTPQPWNTFYAKEALGVKTWDMYDHVIGAYAGKLDKLLSIGGDADARGGKSQKANRFKPMVRFVGPFTLQPGKEKNHEIDIPNYVGSVRVMVVAHNDGAYGEAEKTVEVKKALMLLATLPRVLGPTEEIALPVNVFAMEKHIKDVRVTVESNDFVSLIGEGSKSMKFDKIGDDVVNFKMKVAPKTGIAKFKIVATSGSEKSTEEIEIDVRAPNPVVSESEEIILEAGKSWNGTLKMEGFVGTNKVNVEVSTVPPISLDKRLNYLIQYPHGCLEQTTSTVFPQLYIGNLVDLSESQKAKMTKNIKAALHRFQLFQTENGGFSYWPGEGYESDWATNYAGHFMLEAEKTGFSLPVEMKKRWIRFQQEEARNWSSSSNNYVHSRGKEAHQLIQAYRLYVLALSSHAELGAMNRLREEVGLSNSAKWRLAGAYKLIGQSEVANQLVSKLSTSVADYREMSYTYGSGLRDKAMMLEISSRLNLKTKSDALAKEISSKLNSEDWLTTQETAYSLLGICEYAGIKGNTTAIKYSYQLNGGKENQVISEKKIQHLNFYDTDIKKSAKFAFKNTSNSKLYLKITTEGSPQIGDQSSKASNLKISVKYKDMFGKEIVPEKLSQGTEFKAEITVSNPGKKGIYKELVLNQIFPSGWEIHNARMDGDEDENVPYRHLDIRDDRVYTYFDLAPNESKVFKVQLNATFMGKFYLPTIYAEAMYDYSIRAQLPGKWVEVFTEN